MTPSLVTDYGLVAVGSRQDERYKDGITAAPRRIHHRHNWPFDDETRPPAVLTFQATSPAPRTALVSPLAELWLWQSFARRREASRPFPHKTPVPRPTAPKRTLLPLFEAGPGASEL